MNDFEDWLHDAHTLKARKKLEGWITTSQNRVFQMARTGDLEKVRAAVAVVDTLVKLRGDFFDAAK